MHSIHHFINFILLVCALFLVVRSDSDYAHVRPISTIVFDDHDVIEYMGMMKSILCTSSRQLRKYRFLLITTSTAYGELSQKWQEAAWFMQFPTLYIDIVLVDEGLAGRGERVTTYMMIAYDTFLHRKKEVSTSRFAFIDVRTRFRGSLDELWDEYRYFSPGNWIATPTKAVPSNLDPDYCNVLSVMTFWMKEHQRANCIISSHVVLFDLTNVASSHQDEQSIIVSKDIFKPGFFTRPTVENVQMRWLRDGTAFAILSCQWSSYEGCPASTSGAMHPDVTPPARFLTHQMYLDTVTDDEMARLRPFSEKFYACVQSIHVQALVDFNNQFLGEDGMIFLSSILSPLLRDVSRGVIVDVGASVGTFIERIGVLDHFEYHLFEPSPPHYVILQQKYGNRSNIHITTKALSHYNHTGTQSFFFNPDEATTGRLLSSIVYVEDDVPIYRIEIPVTTLDEYFESSYFVLRNKDAENSLPYEITLLKTDTEGYDTLVMLGGQETLKKSGMVIFECHLLEDVLYGGPGTTQYELAQYLTALGFRVFKIGREVLLEYGANYYNSASDIIKEWSNCMALKRGHPWEHAIYSHYLMMNCSEE